MFAPILQVLLIEDDRDDAELLSLLLEKENLNARIHRLDNANDFREALRTGVYDIILSDYSLPGFSGLEALRIYKEVGLEVPFLLVSGTIGEESAVACLKAGAHDYIMKKNMNRLGVAIKRALQDYADRASFSRAQRRYEQIVEKASEGICILSARGEVLFANPRLQEMLGEELDGHQLLEIGASLPEGPAIHQFSHRSSGKTVWASVTFAALSDGQVLGMLTDVTALKLVERQLQQAQKMEAMGRLAGGIAHDFNNLLSTIIGFTELAQEEGDTPETLATCFQEVLRAARRGASLTRQLLIVGRRQAASAGLMGMNHGVQELLTMLTRLLGPDIHLHVECSACPDTILLDRTHFAQILMNLVLNSRDAMPGGGNIRIGTHNDGSLVLLSVSDDGTGMTAEVQAQVFDPFFTTKDPGKGTGLGLSTVHSILQQSQGRVDLTSCPNAGTSFVLSWPSSEGEVSPERAPEPCRNQVLERTVLVADDTESVRQIYARILERNGFQVLQAANAEEALRIEKEHSEGLDLLLADVMMPGLKGPELASLLRARRPDLRVIFTSGFGNVFDEQEYRADSFLEKPVEAQTLLHSVHSVLGDR